MPKTPEIVKIHRNHATVDDLLAAAVYATSVGDPKAENLMRAALIAVDRAGGDLSIPIRNLTDQAWSERST